MIARLFSAIGGGWILYAILAAVVAAAIGYTYHLGYSSASAKGDARYAQREVEIVKAHAAEVSRIAQANAQAKANEAKRLAEAEADKAALEKKIKELSDEADADPDRDRVCLSDSSRMRIHSVH